MEIAAISYGAAFMVGLLGSGHCLGMCGGLVSAFFMKVGAGRTAPPPRRPKACC
jgi:sulfite exporter TauE/SafE